MTQQKDFYCYGCNSRKSINLKSNRPGRKAQCISCQMPQAKKLALGIVGTYAKPIQST